MTLHYAYCKFDIEAKNDEKVPEISIIQGNPAPIQLILDISSYFQNLSTNAKIEKMSLPLTIQESVYHVDDPVQKKLYLSHCGKHLQRVGKLRDSIRFLEAAHAIETDNVADDVQQEIMQLLNDAYKHTGQFHTESNALCWEMDLFGTNDSKTMSCQSQNGNLIAKRDFNKGDVVFIDKPVVGHVHDSMLQCNCCTLKTLYAVPCMKCRTVGYCSVACQRKDEHYHQYECRGFQMQFFPLTKHVLALRMLVKALDILRHNLLLRRHPLDKLETPQQLWEVLLENHTHSADFLQIFQARTCDHFSTERKAYHTVLQTIPQLLFYLMHEQQLLQDYKLCWIDLTSACRNTFLESVLLRVLFLTEFEACCFKYELAFDKTDYDEMLLATGGSTSLDDKSTSGLYVMKENHYYGLYRFQTEMKSSHTDYNTIAILLDHGAVAFRAADIIKRGDTLIFMLGPPKKTAYLQFDANIMMNPLNCDPCTEKVKLIDHIEMWLQFVEKRPKIFTEGHFLDLLLLFDRFISKYQKVQKSSERIVALYEIINKLDKLYHEARLIPLVLMQDEWMVRLMYRYVRLRAIKRENTEHFIDTMYDVYYLD